MGYALIITGNCLAFLKKNNKAILVLLVFITWLIFSFNNDNPDLLAYQEQYYGVANHYTEPLYVLFQKVCLRSGFSFQAFLCIEAALGLAITAKAITMLSPYPNAVYGLYMIYPFFADVVQVRSFFAQAFILLAVSYLLQYKQKREMRFILIFSVMFIVAVGFHYSAALFAPLFCLFLDVKKHKGLLYFAVPIAILLIPLWIKIMTPVIVQIVGLEKTTLWIVFQPTKTIIGIIKMLVVRVMIPCLILLTWLMTGLGYNRLFDNTIDKDRGYELIYYEENLTLLLAIVYMFMYISMEILMDEQFNRIARTNMIFEYVLFSRLVTKINNRTNEGILWFVMLLFTTLYMLDIIFFRVIDVSGRTWFVWVFRRVFENNSLWAQLLG